MARNKIVGKNKRAKSNKATGRDYSYDTEYQDKKKQVANRVKRNAARRLMTKAKGKAALKGKDVDHKKPLSKGGGNGKKNLRVTSKKKNRARK